MCYNTYKRFLGLSDVVLHVLQHLQEIPGPVLCLPACATTPTRDSWACLMLSCMCYNTYKRFLGLSYVFLHVLQHLQEIPGPV
ncbi:hypothetical protein DPMN_010256 [Dreissena polymorpha]|uniref:Uncharacterized protein n=1 Tax=Dreissena polymorpha TaxID=45954 RepID=A0A9D4N2W8_DREPO|nr:hypothetical protein DPMN_010256 [Dreissena polymorpha]